jgi:hypothetical protein
MSNLLQRIVTPGFITFNAHCWFAYAYVHTFQPHHHWAFAGTIGAAAVKEFYIDKHFEQGQSFRDNLTDFAGYLAGAILALCALRFLAY